MALPNFLIVGAPKAGTTSLARLLSRHPDVFFSRPKETRFFSRDYQKGIHYYERTFFDGAAARLVGEGDVTYLGHPCVPQRIEQDLRGVKIIAILRDPVSRFWSGYLMGVGEKRFSTDPAEIMRINLRQLEEYRQLKSKCGEEAYDRIPWRSELLQNGNYGDGLERYFTIFDRAQILVLIFEDILARERAEVKKIYDFLRVEDRGLLSLPHANIYAPEGMPRFLTKASIRRLLPKVVKERLFNKPALSAELREQLRAYYLPQVRRTEELLGTNLSMWR